jgi:hypothetical protein
MHLNIAHMLFKRILTLIFVVVSLFAPIKNAKEDVTPENLTIKVDTKDLFENQSPLSNIKDENKSLSMSDINK